MLDKRVVHLRDVRCGVYSCLLSGQTIDQSLDMDMWSYCTNGEVDYVGDFVALHTEQLAWWHGPYCVSPEAICFSNAMFSARFQYETRKGQECWETSVKFGRRALLALGNFVPAHFGCTY